MSDLPGSMDGGGMNSARNQPSGDVSSHAATSAEPSAPRRVQLSRAKGWKMPPNTVKVDRTTKRGNPFIVERMTGRELWDPEGQRWIKGRLYSVRRLGGPWFYEAYFQSKEQAAARAVEMFRREVARGLNLDHLRGHNLACWCKPGEPCHADVLLELANEASQ